ncbi:snaclec bothrojaracin subunit beta-like [Argopecten irradians]|uniref:snaclec bothrojaracin subunit beta-like n=1 Tax=Argopecten irradians TaxID=31199 RepID=UPI0037180DDC
MIGQISQTHDVISRGHCAILCETDEMCGMFEFVDDTRKCRVFTGFQQQNGSDKFPYGPRTVYKTKVSGCSASGYRQLSGGLLCFKVFMTRRTWDDAFASCEQDGGRLIVFKSPQEKENFRTTVEELSGKYYLWVGLTDQKSEGEWEFIDGTHFNQSMWPSRFDSVCKDYEDYPADNDCASLSTYTGFMQDCNCNKLRNYICEIP